MGSERNLKWETFYSELTDDDIQRTIKTASNAMEILKNSNDIEQVAKTLAKVYQEIDYLHMFYEGNSRTNRTYVDLLLRESKTNLEINWNKVDRTEMYLARDSALAEMVDKHSSFADMKDVLKLIDKKSSRDNVEYSLEALFRKNLTSVQSKEQQLSKVTNVTRNADFKNERTDSKKRPDGLGLLDKVKSKFKR